jgi:hypothetical protein
LNLSRLGSREREDVIDEPLRFVERLDLAVERARLWLVLAASPERELDCAARRS